MAKQISWDMSSCIDNEVFLAVFVAAPEFGTISQSVITLLADCLRYFGVVLLHVT